MQVSNYYFFLLSILINNSNLTVLDKLHIGEKKVCKILSTLVLTH